MKKKLLALFLSVLMLLSVVSTMGLAQEPDYDPSVDDIFDITTVVPEETTTTTTTTTTTVGNDPEESDPWAPSSSTEPTSDNDPIETDPFPTTETSSSETEPSSSETTQTPTDIPDDPFETAGKVTGAGVLEGVEIDAAYYDEEYYDEEFDEYGRWVYNYTYYKFIPEKSGWYCFESNSEFDTHVDLYDAQGEWLDWSDDKFVNDHNFSLNYEFEAGETYYLAFTTYAEEDIAIDVTVFESTEDYAPVWNPEYEDEFKGEGKIEIEKSEIDEETDLPIPRVIKFVADETGEYVFKLTTEDCLLYVFDENSDFPEMDFDEDDNIAYYLEEGKAYYLFVYAMEDVVISVDKLGEDPTDIPTQSTEPSTQSTEPSTQATEPSSQVTEPSTQATEPSTEATKPTQDPGAEDNFTTKPTEPTTEPTKPTEPSICLHDIVTKNFKKATYFAAGYTGDRVCIKCNGLVEQGKTIAKLKLAKPKFKLKKAAGKKFKVVYKKTAGANRFQVRFKVRGKWKIKTFRAKKNVTRLIKKLKTGKYKVQVRAMIKQGKLKAYSRWTNTKRIKVK